jgi:hypothetical protein
MNGTHPLLPSHAHEETAEEKAKRFAHVDPSSGQAVTGAATITFDNCVPVRISACLGVSNRKGTVVIRPLDLVPVKEGEL